jgi:hypothetical protein
MAPTKTTKKAPAKGKHVQAKGKSPAKGKLPAKNGVPQKRVSRKEAGIVAEAALVAQRAARKKSSPAQVKTAKTKAAQAAAKAAEIDDMSSVSDEDSEHEDDLPFQAGDESEEESEDPYKEITRLKAALEEETVARVESESLAASLLNKRAGPKSTTAGAPTLRKGAVTIVRPKNHFEQMPVQVMMTGESQYKICWFSQGDSGLWSKFASNDYEYGLGQLSTICNFPVTKSMIQAIHGGYLIGLSLLKCSTQDPHVLALRQQSSFTVTGDGKWTPGFDDVIELPILNVLKVLEAVNNFTGLISALLGPSDPVLALRKFAAKTVPKIAALPGMTASLLVKWVHKKMAIYAYNMDAFSDPANLRGLLLDDEHLLLSLRSGDLAAMPAVKNTQVSKTSAVPAGPKLRTMAAVPARNKNKKVQFQTPTVAAASLSGVLGQGYTRTDLRVKACLSWNNFSGTCPRAQCTFPHVCGKCGDAGHQMGIPGCQ